MLYNKFVSNVNDFKFELTLQDPVKHCRTQDCKFFGSIENQYYCSKCWAERRNR